MPRAPFTRRSIHSSILVALLSLTDACTAPRRDENGRCVFSGDCVEPLICAGQYCRAAVAAG